jgi:chemotaxis protein methyltransferase CheR
MAERVGAKTPEQFWNWLRADPDRMRPFVDKVAINVSELFRNPDKFEQLQNTILPELLASRRPLRVWSAGCSYGAEAYSVAMLLHELSPNSTHTILGTDIDHSILERAADPRFTKEDVRHVTEFRKRVFLDSDDGFYRPKPVIRRYVTFRKHDLLHDPFGREYDLILCRNVVIYFADEAKDRLYREFLRALRYGGVLFVGSTERILQSKEIGFESQVPFFYRRPAPGSLQCQHAS